MSFKTPSKQVLVNLKTYQRCTEANHCKLKHLLSQFEDFPCFTFKLSFNFNSLTTEETNLANQFYKFFFHHHLNLIIGVTEFFFGTFFLLFGNV